MNIDKGKGRASLFYCQACKTTFMVTEEEYNKAKEDWENQ